MYQVTKRDGKVVDFDITKISVAIQKAFEAENKEYNQDIIDFLALKVTADYEAKVKDSVRNSDCSCADIVMDEKTDLNMIVFASGWNDGTFPTYFGFDENNKLSRLVTDFMVLEK